MRPSRTISGTPPTRVATIGTRLAMASGRTRPNFPVSHDDAEDLFNFATAICDYVFVLNEKFAQFMQRKQARKSL